MNWTLVVLLAEGIVTLVSIPLVDFESNHASILSRRTLMDFGQWLARLETIVAVVLHTRSVPRPLPRIVADTETKQYLGASCWQWKSTLTMATPLTLTMMLMSYYSIAKNQRRVAVENLYQSILQTTSAIPFAARHDNDERVDPSDCATIRRVVPTA